MRLSDQLGKPHGRVRQRPPAYLIPLALLLALAVAVGYRATRPPGHGDLPAFDQPEVAAMKAAFFDFLRPIAQYHNQRIAEERRWLLRVAGKESPGWLEQHRLERLAKRYGIDPAEVARDEMLAVLKRRVDIVPESLVLIQAAKESGWGRSRMAREGNTLFGERCFDDGCGVVPEARREGASHEVRSFPTVNAAVGSHVHNLNTHPGYAEFRKARQKLRQDDKALSGIALAEYLVRYSERGDAYVEEIISMIVQNDLEAG